MKLKNSIDKISYGHLMSEKAVDRHLFLKKSIDDSILQLLAILQREDDFKRLNISRLANLLILKGVGDLMEMESDDAFDTVGRLNRQFLEL